MEVLERGGGARLGGVRGSWWWCRAYVGHGSRGTRKRSRAPAPACFCPTFQIEMRECGWSKNLRATFCQQASWQSQITNKQIYICPGAACSLPPKRCMGLGSGAQCAWGCAHSGLHGHGENESRLWKTFPPSVASSLLVNVPLFVSVPVHGRARLPHHASCHRG